MTPQIEWSPDDAPALLDARVAEGADFLEFILGSVEPSERAVRSGALIGVSARH
jgi:hypothetical protein